MTLAICQVADTGPAESLVVMLRSIGVDCALPDVHLRDALRKLGCDNVTDIDELVNHWGYERPMDLPSAGIADMSRTDVVYVDVKAHRSGPKVLTRWPNLRGRILWYRINGGAPEHVVNARGDMGDEVNPGCPVLTPNLWYKEAGTYSELNDGSGLTLTTHPWHEGVRDGKFYACWPPFHRFGDYGRGNQPNYSQPMCLVHNFNGWGYGALTAKFRDELGVKIHGRGSPDGLIQHREVRARLESCLAYVHLKSSDAPGYALYEALAAGCPVVCTRRLIWRNRMQDLLVPGETCLVFDRETHDGLTQQDVLDCTDEVKRHLTRLAIKRENELIGQAGRQRLLDVMWSVDKDSDVESLLAFWRRNFP